MGRSDADSDWIPSWIGVDLDATLAYYDGWRGAEHIGPPIPAMQERVRGWLTDGHPEYGVVAVKIVTARVSLEAQRDAVVEAIEAWTLEHLGLVLEVTDAKDLGMMELWDDRAVRVEPNTGRRLDA